MEKLIIKVKYGGLGDHLFYSHIPRIAKKYGGYTFVYLSNKSDFRNKDYKKLIWESNPYIDGFVDDDGINIENIKICSPENENLLDMIMLGFGLDDGKRLHEPEIYYKPKNIVELNNKIIFDPNYISNAGFVNSNKVNNFFKKNNIIINYQLILRDKNSIPTLNFENFIKPNNFWDFIDIIYSCKKVYCLVTGTATLASALKKECGVFYTKDISITFRHSPNNKYIIL